MSESVESRGPAKTVEYGAYEARLFAEMIWKGSVVIAEVYRYYYYSTSIICHDLTQITT